MSFKPFVSVVIPTYNRAQQTIAAIEGVLAQTYPTLEIIVIDDGSTDGSGEAIRRFIDQRANRTGQIEKIRYFRQPNQGPSAARNMGIAEARGEWIAFLDSDDFWLPEKLEWQVRALEQLKNECGACFTDALYVSNSGMDKSTFRLFGRQYEQTIGIDRDAMKLLAKAFCGFFVSTLLARADMIRRIGGFDANVPFAEDRDFYFRLSLVTSLAYIDKPLVRSDRSGSPPGSMCRPWDKVEVRLRGHQRMYENWLRLGTALPADVRKTILQDLRSVHCDWANWHLENARYDEARQAVSRAMTYGPTPRMTVKWALTWIAPAIARKLSGRPAPYL